MKRRKPQPLKLALVMTRAEAESLIDAAALRMEALDLAEFSGEKPKRGLYGRLDRAKQILEYAVDDCLEVRRDEADRRRKEKRDGRLHVPNS